MRFCFPSLPFPFLFFATFHFIFFLRFSVSIPGTPAGSRIPLHNIPATSPRLSAIVSPHPRPGVPDCRARPINIIGHGRRVITAMSFARSVLPNRRIYVFFYSLRPGRKIRNVFAYYFSHPDDRPNNPRRTPNRRVTRLSFARIFQQKKKKKYRH